MHDPDGSEVLSILDQAVAPVWALMDDFTTLFTKYEISQDGVAGRLKAMWRSHTSSLQLLRGPQELQKTLCSRIEEFAQRIGRFGGCMSHTAMNYGLNILPDDVLSEIFVTSAATLKEKVMLSLVCKRFRRVMMSMQKMRDEYWIESTQPPEQIIAIAEGHRFVSLKARIHKPSRDSPPSHVEAWVAKCGLDRTEYTLRHHKFSVTMILSYRPEELVFDGLLDEDWKEIGPILGGAIVQNLRTLVTRGVPRHLVSTHLLESWHIPVLQNLEVDNFVPKPAYAGNLVRWRCWLRITGEHQIYSLSEFLRAAISLQDLQLELCLYSTRPLYDVYDLPSLRSLAVNFVPHPSLARRLIRFQLSSSYHWSISLRRLLDFLSSSDALEQLAIDRRGFFEGPDAIDALPVVTMPSVVSCQLLSYKMSATLIAKLHFPNLRTLELERIGLYELSTITRNEFRTSLQSMSSLEELELMNSRVGVVELDEIIRYAPPHLGSSSLKGCIFRPSSSPRFSTSVAPNQNLVYFKGCTYFNRDIVSTFVDYLKADGLGGVRLQFSDCAGWTDGIFGLDDMMSAEVDQEGLESDGTEGVTWSSDLVNSP